MKRALAAAVLLFFGLAAHAQSAGPEGDDGLKTLTMRYQLPAPVNLPISGNWQTVDGTATAADNDYVPASGTWTIPAGQTQSNPVSVQVVGDRKVEINETFSIVASNVQNGTAPPPIVLTLINDDVPAISVANVTVSEGNAGTTPMAFAVVLTSPIAVPVEISYVTGNGTALAGEDFSRGRHAHLHCRRSRADLTVNVLGDTAFEPDETLTLTVTPRGGAAVAATGTIVNDDLPPPARLAIISGNDSAAGWDSNSRSRSSSRSPVRTGSRSPAWPCNGGSPAGPRSSPRREHDQRAGPRQHDRHHRERRRDRDRGQCRRPAAGDVRHHLGHVTRGARRGAGGGADRARARSGLRAQRVGVLRRLPGAWNSFRTAR